MNNERLIEIAEWLEAGAPKRNGVEGFDMSHFGGCGTTCCIGGTAVAWYAPNAFVTGNTVPAATEALDLTEAQREELFFAWDNPIDLNDITPEHAARCIHKLIATGEVDWLGTRELAQ